MDTIEYATFRYDTVEVENGLKLGVNIVNLGEPSFTRLNTDSDERTGPGWKHSRRKFPRQTG